MSALANIRNIVIPGLTRNPGIVSGRYWIPAFAGMTDFFIVFFMVLSSYEQ